ncbi:hypothetical protein ACLB2K_000337 [Fragaria x ananassa]
MEIQQCDEEECLYINCEASNSAVAVPSSYLRAKSANRETPCPTNMFSYVVRSINLSDLLSSSVKLELRQVANLVDDDLPYEGGCGVFGSKIVFASGLKPNSNPVFGFPFGPLATTDAYAFDVHDPNQGIVKMPALNGGKHEPLMTEFAGKLYVLSLKEYNTYVSFEVFDPQQGTWSRLPKYPNHGLLYSYAIAGTKLFMSTPVPEGEENYYSNYLKQDPSIRCFDLAASDPEWRRVPSMCQGGPLPFTGQALVVDLPQPKHNGGFFRNCLVVHLMSLDENQEDISEIMEMNLPAAALPQEPSDCHLLHLGGNNMCLVNTCIRKPAHEEYKEVRLVMSYTIQGAAIPFQFEFDTSKVDKDRKNCFTAQFQPPRVFKYHIRPDSTFPPLTLGCFVL